MKRLHTSKIVPIFCTIVLLATPLSAAAQDNIITNTTTATTSTLPPVLITELQTGSVGSGKDEFIELYNTTTDAINLANWQIRYFSASSSSVATLDKPTSTIKIVPQDMSSAVSIPAHGYFLLHTASQVVDTNALAQTYSYTLPAAGGSIVLMQPDPVTCLLAIENAFAWGSGSWGEGAPFVPSSTKDQIMQRGINAAGMYADSVNNTADFVGFAASTLPNPANPGTTTSQIAPVTAKSSIVIGQGIRGTQTADTTCTLPVNPGSGGVILPPTDDDSPPVTVVEPDEADNTPGDATSGTSSPQPSQPTIPIADFGLKAPQITEMLVNPAAPQTDANDEFIELYNANLVPFDLSGFELEVGLTTKHHFTFADGTYLPAHGFVAFYAANTGLSMSNSGGQVVLLDPLGNTIDQSDEYGTAKDGLAWALANGVWYWTTSVTPNAANIITQVVAKSAATKTISAKTQKPAAAKVTKVAAAKSTTKSTKKAATKATTADAKTVADVIPTSPVHPVVLAVAAGFAILYGAYEYRRDVANKYNQLRTYRAARRASRQRT